MCRRDCVEFGEQKVKAMSTPLPQTTKEHKITQSKRPATKESTLIYSCHDPDVGVPTRPIPQRWTDEERIPTLSQMAGHEGLWSPLIS